MNGTFFGSPTRDSVLKFIALVGQSYPTQIAQAMNIRLYSVQKAVDSLHLSGMLSSRLIGGVRIVEISRTWFARQELQALLVRLAEADEAVGRAVEGIRKRRGAAPDLGS